MKFLICPSLEHAASQIHHLDLGDRVLLFRMEAYSCKKAGEEKKWYKREIKKLRSDLSDDAGRSALVGSSIGDLTSSNTQKILLSLLGCLNSSFSDYDFTSLNGHSFSKVSVDEIMDNQNQEVQIPAAMVKPDSKGEVLAALKEALSSIDSCEGYVLSPDPDCPLFQGKMWAYTAFLFQPVLKRVLLVSCASKSKLTLPSLGYEDETSDEEDADHDNDMTCADDDSDYDWDDMDEQLAIQAQWLSDDDSLTGDHQENSFSVDAIVDTSLLDLDLFADGHQLPDQTLVTPTLSYPTSSSGNMITLQGKPSPFILPTKDMPLPPDF